MRTRVRRRRLGPAVAIGVTALLAACGGTAEDPDTEPPDAEASASPVTSAPPAQVPPPTGDGLLDALVPLRTLDGNAVDEQWYLWIATEAEPVQVTLPIARTANCGPTTLSVTAVDGGFEVHELRRGLSDIGLACADTGTDERIRTVGALEVGDAGEWWPVQVAPGEGFGGLCPVEANQDAYPSDAALHVAPDAASPTSSGSPAVFALESWPVYEAYPGWHLVGVMHERDLGCAWLVPTG